MQLEPEVLGAAKHKYTARSTYSQLWLRQTGAGSHVAPLLLLGFLSCAIHHVGVQHPHQHSLRHICAFCITKGKS